MSLLCIVDGRRGPRDVALAIASLIASSTPGVGTIYMVAAHERIDTFQQHVRELLGASRADLVHMSLVPPGSQSGAHAVFATARAASASILYNDRVIALWDSGAMGLPGWDTALLRACGDGVVVGCCATREGGAGFTVPVAFQDNALVTDTRGFVDAECGAIHPAGLVPTLCLAARAIHMNTVCTDAIALMGDTQLKLTQAGALVTLAAHRARLRRWVLAAPVASRRYHARIVQQWIHPEFRAMAGGGALEREIGMDVTSCVIYGQGALGLSLQPTAREFLAKTGMLGSELSGAPMRRLRNQPGTKK